MSRFITRSEIAQRVEVSKDVVRHNERRWGIAEHRRDVNQRFVRYDRDPVIRKLQNRGLI
jgi:hypothetical protein